MAVIGGSGNKTPTSLLTGKRGLHYDHATAVLAASAKSTQLAANTNLQTIVDVTGSGALTFCYLMSQTNNTAGVVKITLDGVVVVNETQANDGSGGIVNYGIASVGILFAGNGAAGKTASKDNIPFNVSLKIECQAPNNPNAVYCLHDYYITS